MSSSKPIALATLIVAVGLLFSRKDVDVNLSAAEAHSSELSDFSLTHSRNNNLKRRHTPFHKAEAPLIPNKNQTVLGGLSQEEVYCKLKNMNLGIPIEGEVKIVTYTFEGDENNEPGSTLWVSSSECPSGYHSKISLDSVGRPLEVIDCREMTKEDLVTRLRMQGDVKEAPSEPNKINLAISGGGLFVEDCNGVLSYVRSGRFSISAEGILMTKSACEVLGEDGRPFSIYSIDELDNQGCTKEDRCIAVADPTAKDVVHDGHEKFLARGAPQEFLLRKKYLLKNAYEDLSAELDPFGSEFSSLPALDLETVCPL